MMLKKWGKWLIVLAIVMQCLAGGAVAAETAAEIPQEAGQADLGAVIDEAAKVILAGDMISDWAAIGLSKAGYDIPRSYIEQVVSALQKKDGKLSRVTDYERIALGVMAAGGDAADVGGYNLLSSIANDANLARQGANGVIFALMVLNASDADALPNGSWNESELIQWLIDAQNDDGGWALVHGEESSIDITAMAVTALAMHEDQLDVHQSLVQAVDYLSAEQLSSGGFRGHSAESTAQVIIALSTLGLEMTDDRFVKEGGTPLSFLMSLRTSDGGFGHLPGDSTANIMATEQALMALASVQLNQNGEAGLYRDLGLAYIKVQVEGPEGAVVQGDAKGKTALEALEQLLTTEGIAYEKEVFSFGTLVTSIDSIEQAMFGGYDGWYYAVNRGGEWIIPAVGIDSFQLEEKDKLVVYYSGGSTQLIQSLDVIEGAKHGAVTLAVKQMTWDWTNNKALIAPASQVTVTVGDQAGVTDEDGLVSLDLPAGSYEAIVTGYSDQAAPSVVRTVFPLQLDVAVTIQVEGPSATVDTGSSSGDDALEALERFFAEQGLDYETTVYSFGTSVDSVEGIASGTYGGWDGWMYAVKRGDEWIVPMVSLDAFVLEKKDHIVLYYSNGTKLVKKIAVTPGVALINQPFTVKVSTTEWDWEKNEERVQSAAGVTVSVGGQSVVTNDKGIAAFSGMTNGIYDVVVTGYTEESTPSVVKTSQKLVVAKPLKR
jgi:hypothetical protein